MKAATKKKLAAAMRKRWKSPAFRKKMKSVARKSAKSRKRVKGGRFKNPTFAFRAKKVWRVKRPRRSLARKNLKKARGWYAVKAKSIRALYGRPKKGTKRWVRWKKGGRSASFRNPSGAGSARLARLEKRVNILARGQHAILRHLRGELHQLPSGKKAKVDVMRMLKAYQGQRAREESFLDRAAAIEHGARLNPSRRRRRKGGRRHGRGRRSRR